MEIMNEGIAQSEIFKAEESTFNCLHHAVWSRAPLEIVELILDMGSEGLHQDDAIVKKAINNGRTALHLACIASESIEIIKILILAFPDPLDDRPQSSLDLVNQSFRKRKNYSQIL